jgi:uncharacterized protein (TIGR02594 family)
MNLPYPYGFLTQEPGPQILLEFLKIYGTLEMPGDNADNPVILAWAKECNIPQYTHDSIAWCGLAMSIMVQRAGYKPPVNPLWALNWKNFGIPIPINQAMLGDILIFVRPGGGHVGMYVAEDIQCFHTGGGNTGDQEKIARILKSRCVAVRRPQYTVLPSNIRKVIVNASGNISENEK